MKRLLLFLYIIAGLGLVESGLAQPVNRGAVSISETKQTNRDSLARRFIRSPFTRGTTGTTNGDTVTITGQVIWAPSQSFRANSNRILLYLQDTARGSSGEFLPFSAANITDAVGAGVTLDSTLFQLDTGFVVSVTAITRYVFGAGFQGSYVGSIEFDKINAIAYEILDVKPMPEPVVVPAESLFHPQTITDVRFNPNGTPQQAGAPNYMNGDQYDGMLIKIEGPFVLEGTSRTLQSSGRYIQDVFLRKGNIRIMLGDNSRLLRGPAGGGDLDSATGLLPPFGSIINSITGVLGKVRVDGIPDDLYLGRTQMGASFRIHPRTLADLEVSTAALPPLISRIERPLATFPGNTTTMNVIVRDQNAGGRVDSVFLFYNITSTTPNETFFGPYQAILGEQLNDSTFAVELPAMNAGDFANYFVTAVNDGGTRAIFPDTTLPFRPIIRASATPGIRDIQFSPYSDKRSPLVGSPVTFTATVSLDSADAVYGNFRSYFVQDANAEWSGVQVLVNSLSPDVVKGTHVEVSGVVVEGELAGAQEDFAVRNLDAFTTIDTRGSGFIRPFSPVTTAQMASAITVEPVVLTTAQVAQNEAYEGVLVRVNTVTVTNNNNGFGEFTISSDLTNPLAGYRVDDLSGPEFRGLGTPRNLLADTVFVGDTFQSVTGVHYFARGTFRNIPPRTGGFTGYQRNVLSAGREDGLPKTFALMQNYPNPFNPSTRIQYQLASAADVRLEVYDILGRKVATLANMRQQAGVYTVNFNAATFSTGVYFYRLQAGSFVSTKKMLLVK